MFESLTLHRFCKRTLAVALPMPVLAPVTIATRPLRSGKLANVNLALAELEGHMKIWIRILSMPVHKAVLSLHAAYEGKPRRIAVALGPS